MCGIAGVVSATRESNITEALVHHMCEQIVYRGPDDEGLYVADGAGLGMRRLSIIDLSGGHQPVFNEDRSAWIVFNGEIYNFPELRPELESRGHRFRTHSDTEVIIHLYEEMGADCVQKLRGMFALAIYDKNKRKFTLARDRLGKKPLHYALHEGQSLLRFGNQIDPGSRPGTRRNQLAGPARISILRIRSRSALPHSPEFISFRPDTCSNFRTAKSVSASTGIFPQYNTHAPKSEEECLEELEQRLFEATESA